MNHPATGNTEIELHFQSHAPRDRFDPTRTMVSESIRDAVRNNSVVEAIVLSADIRRSASILKESIDIPHYAHVMDDFVGEFRTVLSYHGGWFDKFTGDGFICYWLVEGGFVEQMDTVLDFSCAVMNNFRTYYYPTFLSNMRNVPSGIGLSIGIDAGPCHLLPIAGDLTVVGSPIVGSVRMNTACAPYQLMLNAYPGSRLLEGLEDATGTLSEDISYRIGQSSIETKEYPQGQESYSVEFFKRGKPIF